MKPGDNASGRSIRIRLRTNSGMVLSWYDGFPQPARARADAIRARVWIAEHPTDTVHVEVVDVETGQALDSIQLFPKPFRGGDV